MSDDRMSQKDVENMLMIAEQYSEILGYSSAESSAVNYLIDYIESGDVGINRSHEGNRLFGLCVDIIKEYLWRHGWRTKE